MVANKTERFVRGVGNIVAENYEENRSATKAVEFGYTARTGPLF